MLEQVAPREINDVEKAGLHVGATIEDLDRKDLNDLLQKTDDADISMIYSNLAKGSRNHLRAFNRQLIRSGSA